MDPQPDCSLHSHKFSVLRLNIILECSKKITTIKCVLKTQCIRVTGELRQLKTQILTKYCRQSQTHFPSLSDCRQIQEWREQRSMREDIYSNSCQWLPWWKHSIPSTSGQLHSCCYCNVWDGSSVWQLANKTLNIAPVI